MRHPALVGIDERTNILLLEPVMTTHVAEHAEVHVAEAIRLELAVEVHVCTPMKNGVETRNGVVGGEHVSSSEFS